MYTGFIITLLIFLFIAFFAVYKRDMLIRMFSLNVSAPANEFHERFEQTAGAIIKRIEDHISHLELLLEEADAKLAELDAKIKDADKYLSQSAVPKETTHILTTNNVTNPPLITDSPSVIDIDALKESQNQTQSTGDDKHRLILAMSAQGYNVTEIAKATGMGKGEIMLLLQLNKK